MSEIAVLLGLSRQTLYDIFAGNQAISPATALRIGKLTGTPAKSWLDLQQAYDLAIARREQRDALREIPVLGDRW